MKRIYTILVAILLTASVFAQAPEKMTYQAVIRNASDQLVASQDIGMQISILQGSATGTPVYVETHNTTTNTNGLVTVEIGNGTLVSGVFANIDWANDVYFIKTEIDPTTAGGTAYTITGTSQLISVPYALHAKTADNITENDPIFISSQAANITGTDITNLGNLSGVNTGDQNISGSGLSGTTLTIGIENGTNETVDLSSLSGGSSSWTVSGNNQNSNVSGNVGIGTNSPSHKLTVYNTGTATMRLYSDGTNGAGSRLNFGDADYVYISEVTDDELQLHADGDFIMLDGTVVKIGDTGTPTIANNNGDLFVSDDLEVGDDVKIEGGIDDGAGYGTNGYVLVTNGSDDITWTDPSTLGGGSGTDDQNISGSGLSGTTLTIGIENGTNETVDLSSLQDGIGTDDQNISGSGLSGTTLTIGIENGTNETVDLSSLQDGIGTDDQNISGSGLSGTTLTIGIEGGNSETVDLSSLQSGSGWNLTGNAGTTNGTDFIGTTDAQDLDIRTNDTVKVRITQKGQIEVLNTGQSVFIGEGAGENDDLNHNDNIFIGNNSGYNNTTGSDNIANGTYSLYYNTTGSDNIANGYRALNINTTGSDNIANGSYALYANTIGASNTANGMAALYSNTIGDDNTANGYKALFSNTTGYSNVAIGTNALFKNTDKSNLVAIGDSALYNNGIGAITSYDATGNTAVGSKALYANTTGNNNTANGAYALYANTTGFENVANGIYALKNNTTGFANTANGTEALFYNTTGYENTANGYRALYANTTGYYNTANGIHALENNTTGSQNTANGYYAFYNGADYDNSTAIGFNTNIGASNTVRLGNSAVSSIGGYANWTNVSDGRFKINVKENIVGLDFIMKLRPVSYNLDMDAIAKFNNTPDSLRLYESEKLKAAEIQTGFIAQEVEQAANEVDFNFHGVDKPKTSKQHYGLRYAEFVMPLVKATQEQQIIIEEQQKTIIALQKQNNEILKRLKKLEK